jgi:hypothetical protein
MKSRSSTGVGQKIDLDYNIETMRITDPGEDAGPVNAFKKPDILNSIRTQSKMLSPTLGMLESEHVADEDVGKITADVQSAKLKQLLGKIKQD